MRLFSTLQAWPSFLPLLLHLLVCDAFIVAAQNGSAWQIQGNGLQNVVQWDHYSLLINGERIFLLGGEMHPFRLPVPELWEDVLEKIKAMGMRMVSIYTHWGFHAPTANRKVDFQSGAHNITRFLEMARDVGLYVLVRPGPYINGELSAGGMPLWVTTGAYGDLRSNGSAFTEAWTPYMDGMAQLVRPFQITEEGGGTVIMYQIENEYANQWRNANNKIPNPQSISYMEKLEAKAKRNGIVVPLAHNAAGQTGKAWSTDYDTVGAGGNVDLYGLDSYPQCWSCVLANCGTNNAPFAVLNYHDHFQEVAPNQPPFMPEFQGGAMNPWDGPAGGCRDKTGPEFVNFYYRDDIAQGVTILNLYMIYGGTNWGWLAAPFVPTSYDYSAAIAEDRSIGAKYYEVKLLGLFTRVADELAKTERIGVGTTRYTNNSALWTTELRNPETGAAFYFVRHVDTSSAEAEAFVLKVKTSVGEFYVPQISGPAVLSGYEVRVWVADFHFAGNNTLVYSTAEVLTYVSDGTDGKTTLVLWVPDGLSAEFYLLGAREGKAVANGAGSTAITFDKRDKGVVVGVWRHHGMSVMEFDNNVRVVLADRSMAYKTWVPALTKDPRVPVNQTALVIGPYLVRSATVRGDTIFIKGDPNATTTIEVFTLSAVSKIQCNGKEFPTSRTAYGSLQARIPGPTSEIRIPELGPWKSHDSLPEREPSYSDSGLAWVAANHTTTSSKTKGTVPYLFADEYGFHAGIRLWRGYFQSVPSNTTTVTGVFLHVQAGSAHGWSTFLNGKLIGSWLGFASQTASNMTLSFANITLRKNESNVLLVMHDDTGHDQQSGATNVRGILNATLLTSSGVEPPLKFSSWRVAGTAGGPSGGLDPLRTYYNEGGLTAERLGWHLPGFDDLAWATASQSPSEGFSGAGVRFYRTILPLDLPRDMDISLAFQFTPIGTAGLGYRAYLYVNGYQFGRYYPSVASENMFPVPAGVLDYGGDNVVGVALWAQTEAGAKVDVDLVLQYAVESSFSSRFEGSYLRPGWDPRRLAYA
ncbi:glycoside hydrolase superfamily [Apodospora peruviana]|uniref:beta-galactosidase n=1 Tax=Apodospora peruviana TaxID=516989 RepID=A0AAE0IJJ6_9PEZI|nr:glycoside hydrolase superfamily [Apodospora peruviana]